MKGDTIVFHYLGGTSDKIWAINTEVRADGKYNVWYGRRNTTLTHDTVPCSEDFSRRIQEKVSKGYRHKANLTIDDPSRKVVIRTMVNTALNDEPVPEKVFGSVWFTIGVKIDSTLIDDYLDDALINLESLDAYLQGLVAYIEISTHKRQGQIEFTEGPMGLLLVFGLRRFLASNSFSSGTKGYQFLIADDDGQILSDDFERLKTVIKAATSEFPGDRKHYVSLDALKPYAIALGCIDAPIDLSAIAATTSAAFF
jgi:hypothetical protein